MDSSGRRAGSRGQHRRGAQDTFSLSAGRQKVQSMFSMSATKTSVRPIAVCCAAGVLLGFLGLGGIVFAVSRILRLRFLELDGEGFLRLFHFEEIAERLVAGCDH